MKEQEAIYRSICIDNLNTLFRNLIVDYGGEYEELLKCLEDEIGECIHSIPAAEVEQVVHGVWVGTADGYAEGYLVYDMWECSICGYDADGSEEEPVWGYCPNCGAKMDGRYFRYVGQKWRPNEDRID